MTMFERYSDLLQRKYSADFDQVRSSRSFLDLC